MTHRSRLIVALAVTACTGLTFLALAGTPPGNGMGHGRRASGSESRVQRGFDIAPVQLNLQGKNRDAVGMGSYIVNATGLCADCHSCPTYAPGHNPYAPGGDGQINADSYLAGGVAFGPFVSRNLTPDPNGRPAGLTPQEFVQAIRTGHDPDDPNQILQVMPWPILRNMTDHDLLSVYAYLSAIPPAVPGTCTGPGE
jgi:cytochrome c553